MSPIFYPTDALRNKIAGKEIVTRSAEKQNAADDRTKAITGTMSKRQDDGNVSHWIEHKAGPKIYFSCRFYTMSQIPMVQRQLGYEIKPRVRWLSAQTRQREMGQMPETRGNSPRQCPERTSLRPKKRTPMKPGRKAMSRQHHVRSLKLISGFMLITHTVSLRQRQ